MIDFIYFIFGIDFSPPEKFPLTVTSYNAEVGQTDSTPCIAGGTGYNICEMKKRGERPIALSQDLISWSHARNKTALFRAGDIVIFETVPGTPGHGDSRCNGEFIVADALNARYKNRGDIFFLDRRNNISCMVIMRKKS